MTTDRQPIHHGKNLKRVRERLGIKQETLAANLGKDWTQSRISHLEQKETIAQDVLEEVTKGMFITPETIMNFPEDMAASISGNTFHDQSIAIGVANGCSFNPIDRVAELYERLLEAQKSLTDAEIEKAALRKEIDQLKSKK